MPERKSLSKVKSEKERVGFNTPGGKPSEHRQLLTSSKKQGLPEPPPLPPNPMGLMRKSLKPPPVSDIPPGVPIDQIEQMLDDWYAVWSKLR